MTLFHIAVRNPGFTDGGSFPDLKTDKKRGDGGFCSLPDLKLPPRGPVVDELTKNAAKAIFNRPISEGLERSILLSGE